MMSIKATKDQDTVLRQIKEFMNNKASKVFILTGYAGTGKTTMVSMIINELKIKQKPYTLLASTGRAAKVLSDKTNEKASTIHHLIYKFVGLNKDLDKYQNTADMEKDGQLRLEFLPADDPDDEHHKEHFYIVDESSMISDTEDKTVSQQARFGTGKLLNDLFNFNPKGKFIFVGDEAQLPPINSAFSPALSPAYIRSEYGLNTDIGRLYEIKRQESDNDLIYGAQKVRNMIPGLRKQKWTKFPLKYNRNIKLYNSQVSLFSKYLDDIRQNGYEGSVMIAYSNRSCSEFSQTIRKALGFQQYILSKNDLLLITQNNILSGLMNGDLVRVISIGNKFSRANLTFVEVEVENLTTKQRFSQLLIEEVLYSGITNITNWQQTKLLIDYYYRMKNKGIGQHSKEFKDGFFTDEYLNALRAVYGYVITCHKAQGGEWPNVYLDIPRNLACDTTPDKCQWLYTGMTRAKNYLHLVDGFYLY